MYKCFHCEGTLCWNSDYNFEDLGIIMTDDDGNELDGIVHVLTCDNCGAYVEYHVPVGIKEEL